MCLSTIIIDRIQKEGPISFCDFMEMALYHPDLGYYSSGREKFGPSGDYFTSPGCTPLFGALIARQMEEMWCHLGCGAFTIVEYGAGNGSLCSAILDALKDNAALFGQLNYVIIEKSPALVRQQKQILAAPVSWCDAVADAGPVTGCILSNEVLDNFAVHQVIMKEELMEIFVDYRNGFTEILLPAADELKHYLGELGIRLSEGSRMEINLQATSWITDNANALKKGFLLTIDYGSSSEALYQPNRSSGTLACYYKHTVNDSPYDNIGEQDITAHVNFSALQHWGVLNELEFCGLTSQAHFLQGLGITALLRKQEQRQTVAAQDLVMLQRFLVDMGRKFKVLIQQKGLSRVPLSGLNFARQLI